MKKKIVFLGSKNIGYKCLKALHETLPEKLVKVLTIDDSSDGRNKLKDIKSYCKENDIPIEICENRQVSEQIIKDIEPDLCLVVGWYWLISAEIVSTYKILGIHNSLLPKYRGGAPLVWSIINNEKYVGFSLFQFTEGMDDGPIYAQRTIYISPDIYIGEILTFIEEQSMLKIKENIKGILYNKISGYEQDHSKASYCTQRTPNDGLIDWNKSALEVYNFIRAQSHPYPGAYFYHNGEKVMIWRAKMLSDIKYYGIPGRVVNNNIIICGNNSFIEIEESEIGFKE